MNLRRLVVLFLILLFSSVTVFAQSDDDARIQEFFTLVNKNNPYVYFDLFGMDEGTTVYVYAESYDIDTLAGVCDIDCEDLYEYNDDIAETKNLNSAFSYTFEDDGDYSIFVSDCCDETASGIVRVLIGLDAPEVLGGNAYPSGDPFAVVYQPTYTDLSEIDYDDDDPQAQQFYGRIDEDNPIAIYEIEDAEKGQTLYVYAESPDFDTAVAICGEDCDDFLAYEDDISSNNVNTSLIYTFEEDGDYQVIIGDCCEDEAVGEFRLLLGYNEALIADDKFLPNGAQITEEYEPPRSLVQTDIDRETQVVSDTCEDIELVERPELSGDEETVETDNFVIHYTTEGDDSAEEDFVQEVVDFVELVLEVQIDELGWPAPPRDCGEGGDTRYDFYLIEILDRDEVLGYASPDTVIGDNPDTAIEEEWSAYGYMILDNDYDGSPNPLVVMRATVAHEFHHLIQFGYDVTEESFWFESTASWMETITSDEEDATHYTSSVFNEPNLCIGSQNDRSGLRIYGEWILLDSIAQDFGTDAIITLWEKIVEYDSMEAFYEFLDEIGTTPEDVLRRYAIRNLLLDYSLGGNFPTTVDVEEFIEDFDTYDSGRDGIEEMAVQYLLIRDSDVYTFELDNDDLEMIVVGINPNDDDVDIFEIGMEGTVDTNRYDYAYLIIMNTKQHDDPYDCEEEDWEIEVSDGSDEDLAEANDESFDVSNFDPAD